MNFLDTQAGYDFARYTVPSLTRSVKELKDELTKMNAPVEAILAKTNEMGVLHEYLLKFAEKNLKAPVFLAQLRSLWTAYCVCKDYEVDTASYDRDVMQLWEVVCKNDTNPFAEFEDFDNFMCEHLV